jgi:hypothetical protein
MDDAEYVTVLDRSVRFSFTRPPPFNGPLLSDDEKEAITASVTSDLRADFAAFESACREDIRIEMEDRVAAALGELHIEYGEDRLAELEATVDDLQVQVDDMTRRIAARKAERAAIDKARADELRAKLARFESAVPDRAASEWKLDARCCIVENELQFARSAIAGRIERRERRLQPVRDQVRALGVLLQREIATLNRIREADGIPKFRVPTDGDVRALVGVGGGRALAGVIAELDRYYHTIVKR